MPLASDSTNADPGAPLLPQASGQVLSLEDALSQRRQQERLDDLQRQVQEAEAERDRMQDLLHTISNVHEQAFRQRLEPLLQRRRELLGERQLLQRALQANQCGEAPAQRRITAPGPGGKERRHQPSKPLEILRMAVARAQPRELGLVILALVLGAALGLPLALRRPSPAGPTTGQPGAAEARTSRRGAAPTAPSAPQTPQLSLRSVGGPSWLEVRDWQNRTLWIGTLDGVQRLPLGQGVRLAAGRPDLIRVRVNQEAERILGRVDEIGWKRIQPSPSQPLP